MSVGPKTQHPAPGRKSNTHCRIKVISDGSCSRPGRCSCMLTQFFISSFIINAVHEKVKNFQKDYLLIISKTLLKRLMYTGNLISEIERCAIGKFIEKLVSGLRFFNTISSTMMGSKNYFQMNNSLVIVNSRVLNLRVILEQFTHFFFPTQLLHY